MISRHRILAVDDNPRNLAILEKALAGEFQLVTTASGDEALEIAPRFRPDLILLDIMMPGIDGYETCRRLREIRTLATCKIIMVSARASTADRLEGYAAGANDYMTKPFDPEELLAKLRVYLRLKSVEEVDRLKSDLLGLLSHETRTPLTTILSPVSLLLEDPGLNKEQRRFVEMIRGGALRLLSLVEKVGYLSQLKSGMASIQPGRLEVGALAGRAVAAVRARIPRADVTVQVQTEPQVHIEGDPQHLESALDAVLDNALRLSPPGGVVTVRTEQAGPWISLAISDQGPGIAPEFLDKLFDEFAVENIRHHSHGHGLGLATARLIVELHGGSMTVECNPAEGTTFRIDLPAPAARAQAA